MEYLWIVKAQESKEKQSFEKYDKEPYKKVFRVEPHKEVFY
jgi:hypothetical protein